MHKQPDDGFDRTWAVAVAVGPLISGSLAANNEWRWLFCKWNLERCTPLAHFATIIDLNLPICAIALILVILFLDLPTPEGSVREKFSRMDWTLVKRLMPPWVYVLMMCTAAT